MLTAVTMTVEHNFLTKGFRVVHPDDTTSQLLYILRRVPRFVNVLIRKQFQGRHVIPDECGFWIEGFEMCRWVEKGEMVLKETVTGQPMPAERVYAPVGVQKVFLEHVSS